MNLKTTLVVFLVTSGFTLLLADAPLELICLVAGTAMGVLLGMMPERLPEQHARPTMPRVRIVQAADTAEELTAIDAMPWGTLPHTPPPQPASMAAQRKRFEATIVPKTTK